MTTPTLQEIEQTYNDSKDQWNRVMGGPVPHAYAVMFDLGILILETLIVVARNTTPVEHVTHFPGVIQKD